MLRVRDISIHLGAWLLYAANSVLTYPSEYLERYGAQAIGIKQGTFYAVMAVGFYINYLVLAPRLLAKKRYGWYATSVLLLIPLMLGLLLLHALFLDWYFDAGTFFIDDRLPAMPSLSFQILFFTLISTGARFTADWFRMQRLRDALKQERRQAELAHLRQQLSPHFLFNTLNNIYSLAVHHPDRAPRAMLMLSALMRAMLHGTEQEETTLREEIAQLHSYIELKRLQYPEEERIRFRIDGKEDDRLMQPMLLLPFVENAFKHGDLHTPGTFVDIHLSVDTHALNFTVENTRSTGSKDAMSGIGLRNVRRRLSLLYPGRHMLEVAEPNGQYRISLFLRFP